MAKILVVEDDASMAAVIRDRLRADSHEVELVLNGADGLERTRISEYDAIVLDWELPEFSGVEICKDLRARGKTTPVLMLTGKKLIRDKEEGFAVGADDYLTKPFHIKELSLRIQSLLRRAQGRATSVLKLGDLILDVDTKKVTKAGKSLPLLPRELALLEFLLAHPDQYFTTEALLTRLWPSDSTASPEALRQSVKRLRTQIDSPDQVSMIRNVHGLGYKIALPE